MTVVGVIITVSPDFIMMLTHAGEDTTGKGVGTDTAGTTNASLIDNCNRTGNTGKIIVIGNGKAVGVCRIINLDHTIRGRNFDTKGKNPISSDKKISNIGNKDNQRFSNHGDRSTLNPSTGKKTTNQTGLPEENDRQPNHCLRPPYGTKDSICLMIR
jgi:hypothetical protein